MPNIFQEGYRLPSDADTLINDLNETFGYYALDPTLTSPSADQYGIKCAYQNGQRSVVELLLRLRGDIKIHPVEDEGEPHGTFRQPGHSERSQD